MNNTVRKSITDYQVAKIAALLFREKRSRTMAYGCAHLMGLIVEAFQHNSRYDEGSLEPFIFTATEAWSDEMGVTMPSVQGMLTQLNNHGLIIRKGPRIRLVDGVDIYENILCELTDSKQTVEIVDLERCTESRTKIDGFENYDYSVMIHNDGTVKVTFAKA